MTLFIFRDDVLGLQNPPTLVVKTKHCTSFSRVLLEVLKHFNKATHNAFANAHRFIVLGQHFLGPRETKIKLHISKRPLVLEATTVVMTKPDVKGIRNEVCLRH